MIIKLNNWLKDNGIVIASLPNVQHFSVLADLSMGFWRYRKSGILDKTHLRFYTYISGCQLFNSSGLDVKNVGRLEQNVNINDKIKLGCAEIDFKKMPVMQKNNFKTLQFVITGEKRKLTDVSEICPDVITLTHNELKYTEMFIDSLNKTKQDG